MTRRPLQNPPITGPVIERHRIEHSARPGRVALLLVALCGVVELIFNEGTKARVCVCVFTSHENVLTKTRCDDDDDVAAAAASNRHVSFDVLGRLHRIAARNGDLSISTVRTGKMQSGRQRDTKMKKPDGGLHSNNHDPLKPPSQTFHLGILY